MQDSGVASRLSSPVGGVSVRKGASAPVGIEPLIGSAGAAAPGRLGRLQVWSAEGRPIIGK
ncbi:hypothetical protein GCM10010425_68650 [Streptomyces spororaveus]|uniref:Uncharacterized protein n=1 Tax=Streptomyces spororaveus TaxID=284039 RepID=A0ABQ3T326_9ACTN|nr:hypothetical protein Sspor_03430 [Streptomyces spororaveus]